MRFMGQARGGFYPAPPAAVKFAAGMLKLPEGQPVAILDPCCGKGEAIRQLASELGAAKDQVYAIELDEKRAATTHDNLAGGHVLAPASFLGCAASAGTFSYAWVNPPFDDECGGGGRVEAAFLRRVTMWLVPKGVLQLICPARVAKGHEVTDFMLQWYDRITVNPFPAAHRKFDEVVVTAQRRGKPQSSAGLYWYEQAKEEVQLYELRPSLGPKRFEKTAFTDEELLEAVRTSPLRKFLETPKDLGVVEPPLPLSTGHIALLLASGKLDGAVYPKGEPPHVVRGTASKQKYQSDQQVTEMADGGNKTTTVYSEKIVLTIRAVGSDGEIKTFGE
jgi:hypothetical protein